MLLAERMKSTWLTADTCEDVYVYILGTKRVKYKTYFVKVDKVQNIHLTVVDTSQDRRFSQHILDVRPIFFFSVFYEFENKYFCIA